MSDSVLIELDDRRRVSLGRLASHDRYLATVEPDGTIVLHPAVVMTAAQAKLDDRPELSTGIDTFLADPSGAVSRPRPRRR
jgi:hypothetical protein